MKLFSTPLILNYVQLIATICLPHHFVTIWNHLTTIHTFYAPFKSADRYESGHIQLICGF